MPTGQYSLADAKPIGQFSLADAEPVTPTKAPVNIENRRDSNVIGIDYNWIADKASRLPESLRRPTAAAAAFLGHVLESVSAPETVATMGLGRVPTRPANLTPEGESVPSLLSSIPRPSGAHVLKAVKVVRHPLREGLKALADELIARMEPAAVDSGPPQVGRLAGRAPTVNDTLESVLHELRQSLPEPATIASRTPEYPQAARDTMRLLAEREAARQATVPIADVPTAGRVVGKAPTVNASVEQALQDLRTAPAPSNVPARLPEYPQAAEDTMRMLRERQAVQPVSPTPARAVPQSVPSSAPPVPAPTAAIPSSPPVATKPMPFNPSAALTKAREVFASLGEKPRPAEISNASEMMRVGVPPEEAVARVIAKRPPMSPAEELAARLGTPTDAERQAAQDLRWMQGKVKTPSAETARAARTR